MTETDLIEKMANDAGVSKLSLLTCNQYGVGLTPTPYLR